ncbi:MAG: hypothetical protein ACR5K6_00615 [Wolbachia sp.]
MSSSTSEEKKNSVVTLKAQAEKFNFSMLRADEKNTLANSGETMFLDFYRMNFVVNKKSIDSTLIFALIKGAKKNGLEKAWDEHCKNEKAPDDKKTDQYKKKFEEFYNLGTNYTNLLPKEEAGSYRPFAKQVFKEMFKHAGAQVPSDPFILEELVTHCNQAGYEGALFTQISLSKYGLMLQNPVKVINIDCTDINHITVKSDMIIPIVKSGDPEEEACRINSSLEFTLESQDGKDGVTYKDGKLLLTISEKLKDYLVVDEMQQSKSLFDVIKEIFL